VNEYRYEDEGAGEMLGYWESLTKEERERSGMNVD